MALNNNESFFSRCVHFPVIDNLNAIETEKFLSAAKSVVQFVELLGAAFIVVRNDINGNITKLSKIYESDLAKYRYLNDILVSEQNADQTPHESPLNVGTDALQWLTRALTYHHIFLEHLLKDFDDGYKTENMSAFFSDAYDQSLRKYHNWFVQKISALCLLATPSRHSLLKHIAGTDDNDIDESAIFNAIRNYVKPLNDNILAINLMFDAFNIER